MKKTIGILFLLLLLLPPAALADSWQVPSLGSFSGGAFTLAATQEYDMCVRQTFTAPAGTDDGAVVEPYISWLEDAGYVVGGYHDAEPGVFGDFAQSSIWFSHPGAALTGFDMDLKDMRAENCHIFIAAQYQADQTVIHAFYAHGISTEKAMRKGVQDLYSFAAEAAAEGTLSVVRLKPETAESVLAAYTALLEEAFGFTQRNEALLGDTDVVLQNSHSGLFREQPELRAAFARCDRKQLIWFGSHADAGKLPGRVTLVNALNQPSIRASLALLCLPCDEGVWVAVLPSSSFSLRDSGRRWTDSASEPTLADLVPQAATVAVELPSFESFAGDLILRAENGSFALPLEEGVAAMYEYMALLEERGLGGLRQARSGDLVCLWYTEYSGAGNINHKLALSTDDVQGEGYVWLIFGASGEELVLRTAYGADFILTETAGAGSD